MRTPRKGGRLLIRRECASRRTLFIYGKDNDYEEGFKVFYA